MSEKTHAHWLELIEGEFVRDEKQTAQQILNKLVWLHDQSTEDGDRYPTDPPSLKTIQRVLADLKDRAKSDPQSLDRFRLFSWPDSMDKGLVPWEASEACFDLLRGLSPEVKDRIPVGLVNRFWRVTQAAPTIPILDRLRLAARWTLFHRRGFAAGVRWCQVIILQELWNRKKWPPKRLEEIGLRSSETIWDLPPEVFYMADRMGLVDVELSLMDHHIGVLRKENAETEKRIALGQLGDLQGRAPKAGATYKGGGILDPANWKTENPGDEN